jgi:hypothetical protein
VLRPDRTAQVIELAAVEAATPAGLHAAIGCEHVEVVTLAGDLHMWLDGEGPRANPVPSVNVIAALLGAAFGRGTRYVGTVVLTGGADRHGNPCGLSDERLGGLLGHLEQLGTGKTAQPTRHPT